MMWFDEDEKSIILVYISENTKVTISQVRGLNCSLTLCKKLLNTLKGIVLPPKKKILVIT